MSRTIERKACPECQKVGNDRSGNNLSFFNNTKGFLTSKCMREGCSYKPGSRESDLNVNQVRSSSYMNQHSQAGTNSEELVGDHQAIPDRGLSILTIEEFEDYQIGYFCNRPVHIEKHRNIAGDFTRVKVRYVDKKQFQWVGEARDEPALFGLHKCKDYSSPLVITEGAIDHLSCLEAGYQACSLPEGAKSVEKTLNLCLNELSKFETIIVWFDTDSAGETAFKKATEILPWGKIYKIETTRKDANEVLTLDSLEMLQTTLFNATEWVPSGLIYGDQIDVNTLLEVEPAGRQIELQGLNETLKGLRPSTLTTWVAGTGVGKSTVVKSIVLPLLQNPQDDYKIAHIFLEESTKFTIQSYIGMDNKMPVHKFEDDPEGVLGKDKILQSYNKLLHNKNNIFLDHFGSLDNPHFLKLMHYLTVIKKFDLVILDHISMVISGMKSSKEGERKDLDILGTYLKKLTMESNSHIMCISHLNRPQGEQGYEEGRKVTLNSIRSSSILAQASNAVIAIERNTQSENEKDKVTLRVLKNRRTGKLGVVDTLYFMESEGVLLDAKGLYNENI